MNVVTSPKFLTKFYFSPDVLEEWSKVLLSLHVPGLTFDGLGSAAVTSRRGA